LVNDPYPDSYAGETGADDTVSRRRPPLTRGSVALPGPNWSAPYEKADGQTLADTSAVKDIIYVVSPTTVMSKHMKNSNYSSISDVYRPYRFFSSADCSSPDPMNPALLPSGSLDCPAMRRIDYQFINTDATQYDPSTVGLDPTLVRQFPVCALQPTGS
jgi:hypothetical protein